MSEIKTPPGGAPSAEEVQEHVAGRDEELNLGAGDQEPDPATAEDPPADLQAGDEKRNPA
ncbi:MAG: hypothetical protein ACRDTG_29515 [Pseudonocardiaceae bacterium]